MWQHFLRDLGRIATVVRYDERGFGMSDWDVSDFSLQARVIYASARLVQGGGAGDLRAYTVPVSGDF